MSLAKLGAGVVDYLEEMVARGVEEYYANAKEAPGEWLGQSSTRLGLDGVIDADDFRRVLSGAHPDTGERLTSGKSMPKVVGLDATFCAPKSASLLFALGGSEVSNEARNAHDTAITEAFDVLQSLARGRRDRNGTRLVAGDGLMGAAYRHRTSRAADPHLHTHVVIPNLVYAPEDRRWSALDARPLYAWCRTVGFLYQAQLRYELSSRLGVRWQPVSKGMAEIAGFERAVLREFSTRRREIERELADAGRSGAKAAQRAAYKTRRAKDPGLDGDALFASWQQRAAALGLDDQALALVGGDPVEPHMPLIGSPDAEALFERFAGPDGLTAKRSTFDLRHVIEAVCDALPDGGRIEDVIALANAFVASEHVLVLDAGQGPPLRRADGRSVPSGDALVRMTTPEMLATEQRLMDGVARRQHERIVVVRREVVADAIAKADLGEEQAAMVRHVCSSGAGVDVIEGVAGSGKTTALAVANNAWTASGMVVRGCALAARAAAGLQDASGIPSTTLDGLLRRLDRGDITFGPQHVVVVDEAGMVGTRKLGRLLDHAGRTQAKVVLIGDPRQLPEIEAGGAFAALNRTIGRVMLASNRRQVEPWERHALAALRDGCPEDALNAYRAHDRIHTCEDARAAIVSAWVADREAGGSAVMIAARLSDVEALNGPARTALQARGGLASDELILGDRAFCEGDEVIALRNAYDIGVLNGARLRVMRVDRADEMLRCRDQRGREFEVPFSYAVEGHLAHGYAITIHKAQGATVSRAFVLADDAMTNEQLYTALSRATMRTDVYLDVGDRDAETHAPMVSLTTAERLRNIARRFSRQGLGIEGRGRP